MEPFEKQENNGNAVPILYQLIYIHTYIICMLEHKTVEINLVISMGFPLLGPGSDGGW